MQSVNLHRGADNCPCTSPAVPILNVYEGEINNVGSPTQEIAEGALLKLQAALGAGVVNIRISERVFLNLNCQSGISLL